MVNKNNMRVVVNRTRAARLRQSREELQHNKGSSRLSGVSPNIPSLKEFLHRQNVRRQYRDFFRVVNSIKDDTYRIQGRAEVRKEFEALKYETDKLAVSMAIKEVCLINKNWDNDSSQCYFVTHDKCRLHTHYRAIEN